MIQLLGVYQMGEQEDSTNDRNYSQEGLLSLKIKGKKLWLIADIYKITEKSIVAMDRKDYPAFHTRSYAFMYAYHIPI